MSAESDRRAYIDMYERDYLYAMGRAYNKDILVEQFRQIWDKFWSKAILFTRDHETGHKYTNVPRS